MSALNELSTTYELSVFGLGVLSSCLYAVWPFRRRPADGDSLAAGKTPSPPNATDIAPDLVEWGIRLASLGKIELAEQRFRRALEKNPNDPAAHYNLGLALDIMERHSDAVASLSRAVELAPDFLDARVNLGVALLQCGNPMAAVDAFKRAFEMALRDHAAAFGLGCAYLAAGELKSAVDSFRIAIEIEPKDPETRFNLAMTLREAGCPDLAERELQEFMALAADSFPEHRSLAEKLLAETNVKEECNPDAS